MWSMRLMLWSLSWKQTVAYSGAYACCRLWAMVVPALAPSIARSSRASVAWLTFESMDPVDRLQVNTHSFNSNSRHVRQPIPRQPRLLPSPNHHHRQSVDVKRSRLQVWYPHRRRACACQSLVWPARSACITSPCRCKSIKLSQPSQRLLSNCSSPSSYRKQLC